MSTDSKVTRARKGGAVRFLRDVLVIVLIAMLVSFLVKTFLVRSFYIPSGSMLNTLEIDDRILVNELQPRLVPLERGDIVVFTDPGGWLNSVQTTETNRVEWLLSLIGLAAPDSDDHLIKRVIGLPGDRVVCCNSIGRIEVNGVSIDEPYLMDKAGPASQTEFAVTVPANSLWVMGDNRNNSADSRAHMDQPGKGFVPVENIVGRAFLITWPINKAGFIGTPEHSFNGVPAAD